jgi:hypothetical protein
LHALVHDFAVRANDAPVLALGDADDAADIAGFAPQLVVLGLGFGRKGGGECHEGQHRQHDRAGASPKNR